MSAQEAKAKAADTNNATEVAVEQASPEAPSVETAFGRLQEVMQDRVRKRESMLQTFRKLVEKTILTLRGFNVFSVEEWDGGFSFTIGEFGFVMQLSEFDDGRMWPITLWLRHDDVEVWKRVDESEIALSADAPDQVIFRSEAMDLETFLARGLFTQLADALKDYTVTEEDAEEGWTDEDLFED